MNYGMASANRVTWSASRGAYSQRRLMLWAADTAGATVEGRRFMPPAGSGGGTQPAQFVASSTQDFFPDWQPNGPNSDWIARSA